MSECQREAHSIWLAPDRLHPSGAHAIEADLGSYAATSEDFPGGLFGPLTSVGPMAGSNQEFPRHQVASTRKGALQLDWGWRVRPSTWVRGATFVMESCPRSHSIPFFTNRWDSHVGCVQGRRRGSLRKSRCILSVGLSGASIPRVPFPSATSSSGSHLDLFWGAFPHPPPFGPQVNLIWASNIWASCLPVSEDEDEGVGRPRDEGLWPLKVPFTWGRFPEAFLMRSSDWAPLSCPSSCACPDTRKIAKLLGNLQCVYKKIT